jgi:hypothetical protein
VSLRERANRPSGVATPPDEVRLISFIALGWGAVALLGVAYFVHVLAPSIGNAMDLHFEGKKGGFDIPVVTDVLSAVSYWVAGLLIVLAVVAVVIPRSAVKASNVLGTTVCMTVPFYLGVLLPNGWLTLADPDRGNFWVVLGVGVAGIGGLVIGGLSFTFGPAIIDVLMSRGALSQRKA